MQLLLGHSKLESTVRYLGIEVDDALEMGEQTEKCDANAGGRLINSVAPLAKTRHSTAKFNSPQSGHWQTVMLGFRQGLAPAYRVGPPVSI